MTESFGGSGEGQIRLFYGGVSPEDPGWRDETHMACGDQTAMDPLADLLTAPKPRPVRLLSADIQGIEARLVEIQASVFGAESSPPRILGLPDAAVREAYHRVRTAFQAQGLDIPRGQVVVNLAPARNRKAGSAFDLGIAVALASVGGYVPATCLAETLFVGELDLDGRLRAVPGTIARVELARRLDIPYLLCPIASAALALRASQGSPCILPAEDLGQALRIVREGRSACPSIPALDELISGELPGVPDLTRVRGQESARRALFLAAAGAHNLLLSGPPGCGKSLLASCLPGLLPLLSHDERLEVLRIQGSFHAEFEERAAEALERGQIPFRAPHHTISHVGLVGGGVPPHPGEISMAHRGVLFLDELPEFRREALESLRQPLEQGHVHIRRAKESYVFPASFQLIAAMNPCPCGLLGHPSLPCRCTGKEIQRYRSRISAPLLDRIDLQLVLQAVPAEDLLDTRSEDAPVSPTLRKRVTALRKLQRQRNAGLLNSELAEDPLRRMLIGRARKVLLAECRSGRLSARAITRVLRLARTIADEDESSTIEEIHVAQALQLRHRLEPMG